jgi:hypothetical protein
MEQHLPRDLGEIALFRVILSYLGGRTARLFPEKFLA